MNKFKLILIFSLGFLFFAFQPALAHNPRLVGNSTTTPVYNSDISQAFYGEMPGVPVMFTLDLKDEQELYVQILVPDAPNIATDKSVTLTYAPEGEQPKFFGQINGLSYSWKSYFENIARDNYFQGPELKKIAQPGKYQLIITSPDNTGKYVLVVGQKEAWSLNEIWQTVKVTPTLKAQFFQKSIFTAYFNYVGLAIIIPLILIIGLIFLIRFIIKKIKSNKNKK